MLARCRTVEDITSTGPESGSQHHSRQKVRPDVVIGHPTNPRKKLSFARWPAGLRGRCATGGSPRKLGLQADGTVECIRRDLDYPAGGHRHYGARPSVGRCLEDITQCRNSQAVTKTGAEEDFRSQIARYEERSFWARGGHRFSGSCLGKQGCKRSLSSLPGLGSGNSTLVNHWLGRMAAEHYHSAELVLGGPSTARAQVGLFVR
jgi:hypothetical protein